MRHPHAILAAALLCLGGVTSFASSGRDGEARRFTLKAAQRGKNSFERAVTLVLEVRDKPVQVTLPRTAGSEHPDLFFTLTRSTEPKESYLVAFSLKHGETLLDQAEVSVSPAGGTGSLSMKCGDEETTYEVTIESVRKPLK